MTQQTDETKLREELAVLWQECDEAEELGYTKMTLPPKLVRRIITARPQLALQEAREALNQADRESACFTLSGETREQMRRAIRRIDTALRTSGEASPSDDDWRPHKAPGVAPANARRVEVRYANGRVREDFANQFAWANVSNPTDYRIVEYRITERAPSASAEPESAVGEIKAHVERYDTPKEDDPRRRYTIAQLETAIRLALRTRDAGADAMRPAMDRAATIIERNLYHQREKVEDAARILRAALNQFPGHASEQTGDLDSGEGEGK